LKLNNQQIIQRGFGDNASAKLARAMRFADFIQAATLHQEWVPH
jgi:hypothetical protein